LLNKTQTTTTIGAISHCINMSIISYMAYINS